MSAYLAQPIRLWLMAAEIVLFWAVFGAVLGSWDFPGGTKGFYFYTGLLGLILGARIATPFFQRPADVIAYAVPAMAAVLLAPVSDSSSYLVIQFQQGLIFFYAAVMAAAFFAIAFKDSESTRLRAGSESLRTIAGKAGSPIAIFGPLIFFALYAFHYDTPREFLLLSVAALCLVLLSPLESALLVFRKLRRTFQDNQTNSDWAEIIGVQMPGVILLRGRSDLPRHGETLQANDPYCPGGQVIAMDVVGRDEGLLLRTLVVPDVVPNKNSISMVPKGMIGLQPQTKENQTIYGRHIDQLCGLVAVDSSVSTVQFEVTKAEGLEVGSLLSVRVADSDVLYQVVDGITKEEVVQQKNTYGYVKASAKQVGIWEPDLLGFRSCRWLPLMNSPVFIERTHENQVDRSAIGYFPGSSYPVRIGDIDSLVTHNCAILGVLGVGKSSLAFVLIERLLAEGKKVIVLDITGQYRTELASYLTEEQGLSEARLEAAAANGAEEWNEVPSLGGSLVSFRAEVRREISSFMNPERGSHLLIIDPMRINVTKQFSEPKNVNLGGNNWQRSAQIYPVTATEITRIISETSLDVLSAEFSRSAKLCLVYEEAHSLVPEWTSIVAEGDKTAVAGTARAILQGRKYGLGCMVVSQRTANVTKTILNQCSTIFAMRSFDDTSKDFLSNYIGADFARVLPTLADRQAVVFGRASSCVNPVLMQVVERARLP